MLRQVVPETQHIKLNQVDSNESGKDMLRFDDKVMDSSDSTKIIPDTHRYDDKVMDSSDSTKIIPDMRRYDDKVMDSSDSTKIIPDTRRYDDKVLDSSDSTKIIPEMRRYDDNQIDSSDGTKVVPESDEYDECEMDYASQIEEIRLRHMEYIRLSPSPKIKKQFRFMTATLLRNIEDQDNRSDTSGGKKIFILHKYISNIPLPKITPCN